MCFVGGRKGDRKGRPYAENSGRVVEDADPYAENKKCGGRADVGITPTKKQGWR